MTHFHRRPRVWSAALSLLLAASLAPAQPPQPPATRGNPPRSRIGPGAPPTPATPAPPILLAHRLDQLARSALAPAALNGQPAPASASRLQLARTLLNKAAQLNPADAELCRLLMEAGGQSADEKLHELTRYVQLAPQDDWAQLRLIQLLADRAQTVDQRVAIYHNILTGPGAQKLSPALRSRVAVIAAGLRYQQTDLAGYINLIKQAIALDDTNRQASEDALRFLQQHHASRPDIAQAVLNLVASAPADASAHADLAGLLLDCGQYSMAVNWYQSANQIAGVEGQPPAADMVAFYSNEALALWGAGRPTDALRLIDSLAPAKPPANVKDTKKAELSEAPAPPRLLMIAVAIQQQQGHTDVAADTFKRLDTELQRRAAAAPGSVEALTDLVWAHLLLGEQVPAIEPLLKPLRAIQRNPELMQRIDGWYALRTGKLNDARKMLTAGVDRDVYCRFGLYLADEATLKPEQRIDHLNHVFAQDPGEFVGVIAAVKIKAMAGRPVPAPDCMAVGRMAEQLPRDFQRIASEPRRFVMLRAKPVAYRYPYAQPIEMDLELTNVWNAAMSLGPGQTLSGTVLISPTITTSAGKNLAMAPEVVDLARRIRLGPREALSVRVPVDVGALGEYLTEHPTETVRITFTAVLNPRLTTSGQIVPGLLGSAFTTATVERTGWDPTSPQLVAAKVSEVAGADKSAAMLAAALLVRVAPTLPAAKQDVAQQMGDAVNAAFAKRFDTVQQAWTAGYLPNDLAVRRLMEPTVDAAVNSSDPTVVQMIVLSLAQAPDSPILSAGLRSQSPAVRDFAVELKKVLAALAKPAK